MGKSLTDCHQVEQIGDASSSTVRRRAVATVPDDTNEKNNSFLPADFCAESRKIAYDLISYTCHRGLYVRESTDKVISVLRRLVDDTLESRLDMMREMAARLEIRERKQLKLIDSIATEMFSDQVVNWGRVVTLIAFSGYLARHCEETGVVTDCVDDVSRIVADVLINRLGLWLVIHGGWASVEKQFSSSYSVDTSGVWKGVLVMVLLIGTIVACYSSARL